MHRLVGLVLQFWIWYRNRVSRHHLFYNLHFSNTWINSAIASTHSLESNCLLDLLELTLPEASLVGRGRNSFMKVSSMHLFQHWFEAHELSCRQISCVLILSKIFWNLFKKSVFLERLSRYLDFDWAEFSLLKFSRSLARIFRILGCFCCSCEACPDGNRGDMFKSFSTDSIYLQIFFLPEVVKDILLGAWLLWNG